MGEHHPACRRYGRRRDRYRHARVLRYRRHRRRVPIGISYFVVNAILITAAVFIIGAKFGIKTIYSIILMSIAMSVMQAVIPNNILGLANDKLLSALLGGGVAGLGISLVLMQGGSTGGSDIIAMIINKYRNISYGRVVLVTDCIIIGASYFIEHNLAQVIYGYVLTATFSVTADVMLAGNKQSAQIFVMSEHYKEIADLITNDFHRGVTLLDGTGWYTKKPTKVIMVMVRKTNPPTCSPKSRRSTRRHSSRWAASWAYTAKVSTRSGNDAEASALRAPCRNGFAGYRTVGSGKSYMTGMRYSARIPPQTHKNLHFVRINQK